MPAIAPATRAASPLYGRRPSATPPPGTPPPSLSSHVDVTKLPDPRGRFRLERLIGEGTYGEVHAALDTQTGQRVAVKILENPSENAEELEEEFRVLRDLSLHPNLPSFHGLFFLPAPRPPTPPCTKLQPPPPPSGHPPHHRLLAEDQVWFAMELCSGGSVTDLVQGLKRRGEGLTEDQIAYILRETVEALVYLHSNHCMHRDIKGHNILLTEDAHIKLVDFGVSSHLGTTLGRRNTSVGTPYWMAPEVIACEQQLDASYDCRCDVWSVGITAIELAEGQPPLSSLHPMRALFRIPRSPPPTLAPELERASPALGDFVGECLVKDMEQRPFAHELLEHPLLRGAHVHAERVRQQLRREIKRQRREVAGVEKGDDPDGMMPEHQQLPAAALGGPDGRRPEPTTKHGRLRIDRHSRPKRIECDDLAASSEMLSENSIVDSLQRRFERGQIYTYIGDILVAVNPFTDLGLYTDDEQKRYMGAARSSNPPHIFAVADSARQSLVHRRRSVAVIIGGESGAGKTRSANLLLKQLVFLGKTSNRTLEERILQVNPIMEAFGNARTGINENSSRFGKFLELTMTPGGKVTGARITVYLLEQSRIVRQAKGERNFHVFYYLYDGLEHEGRLEEFHLFPDLRSRHRYLGGDSNDRDVKEVNVMMFEDLCSSFRLMDFVEPEVDTIFGLLAAIIHLGDLQFGEVISSKDNTDKSRIVDLAPLHRASKLLGVEAAELLEALTSCPVVTRGETIARNNTVGEAVATRDALAKGLYGRLFDWIVNKADRILLASNAVSMDDEQLAVGLLDIFGFENFPRNSFEQLCINIANEQMQFFFNQHIFTWEQQEYMSEGIPVDLVEFSDNRPVLDLLLSRPVGLLALLDEESRFPRASDRSLVEKFHGNLKSKFYVRPKSDALCFAVHHYAGRVVYQGEGLLEKNRSFLSPTVVSLLRGSSIDIVRFLFHCPLTRTGNLYSADAHDRVYHGQPRGPPASSSEKRGGRPFGSTGGSGLGSQSRSQQTAATVFRNSLSDLLRRTVESGDPHFVRCFRPCEVSALAHAGGMPGPRGGKVRVPKVPFDTRKVISQLRYAGILETVRIRRDGFSHRIPFRDFLKRYCFLAFGYEERVTATRDNCRLLLLRLKMDGWALGKTKVFLKYYHIEFLSKLYEEQISKIIRAQACIRRWLARSRYQRDRWRIVAASMTLQRYVRGWLVRRRMQKMQSDKKKKKKEVVVKGGKKQPQGRRGSQAIVESFVSRASDDPNERDRAARVIQRCFRRHMQDDNHGRGPGRGAQQRGMKRKTPSCIPELISFSQHVHMLNQEAHKYLRQGKPGIRLTSVGHAPPGYSRPNGFDLLPRILEAEKAAAEKQSSGGSRFVGERNMLLNRVPRNGENDAFYNRMDSYYKKLQEKLTRMQSANESAERSRRKREGSSEEEEGEEEGEEWEGGRSEGGGRGRRGGGRRDDDEEPQEGEESWDLPFLLIEKSFRPNRSDVVDVKSVMDRLTSDQRPVWQAGAGWKRRASEDKSKWKGAGDQGVEDGPRSLMPPEHILVSSQENVNKTLWSQSESELRDYRRRLRPTSNPPTESLRKRKGHGDGSK
ncbi:myosin-IIIb-like [Ischnura elegans]|uniref:myosin-IIIb-like n=1 Tax=Ischnura elegans TaxID=197161 RepID=UPI001ED8AE81|nr:myosin-IIIb-like [Ischnura elegans]